MYKCKKNICQAIFFCYNSVGYFMSFSDQFKNKSTKKILNGLVEKYKPNQIKKMSQNEIIQKLEEEKTQEKDEKMRANYDLIIQAVKDFFAKKFDKKKAQITILRQVKENKLLVNKAMILTKKHPELEEFAKSLLGGQFVEFIKKNNAYTKEKNNNAKNSAPQISL